MGSHTATHVDAPSHMHKNRDSIENIDLSRFCGQAQLVKISNDYPKNIGLLFNEPLDINNLDKILKANPNFVGGDLSEDLERILLKNNIITYTNLVNFKKLPFLKTFVFYGLPLKIKDGDGSPVRTIAILDK